MDNIFTKIDIAMLKTAYVWAELSYCERRQVGAVITRDGRIIAHGYNGTAPGQENVCEKKIYTCVSCGKEIDVTDKEFYQSEYLVSEHGGPVILTTVECSCGACASVNQNLLTLKTHDYVIHAEQNAIASAAKLGIMLDRSVMYTTTLPCNECAKMIVASGIIKVYYSETYKADLTLDYFAKNNVELIQMKLN